VGEASILSRIAFLSFVCWDFEAVVQHGRYVAAHDARGTLRCLECLTEPSRTVVPLGLLLHSRSPEAQGNHDHDSKPLGRSVIEVAGVKAIVTMIPELTGRRGYGMCRTFRFCAAVPLGLLLCSGSHWAWGNHDHNSEPLGCRTAEVTRVKAVVTTIPEPTGRHTYGMCGMFYFLRCHTTTFESSDD
jgi:hypothetical protein